MFVPESDMGPDEWKQFAKDGDRWDPRKKCRGVILGPGDVFVLKPGLVHAVLISASKIIVYYHATLLHCTTFLAISFFSP